MLPDLKYALLPTVWLNKNDTRDSPFNRMKDVHFLHRLQPDDCPEWVRAELPNFDKDRDLILDAVCYAGEDNLKSSHTLALEFGDWAPQEVTRWTQGPIEIQNLQTYQENMVTVTRGDNGASALLKFNVQNADAGGAEGWFLCECEVGEEDQKTKHRIVLHVFFAGEQPASIAFENIGYPDVQFGTATNEDKDIPPADARTETLRSFFRDAAKGAMWDYKDGMFSPPENDMWSLYLRNGLLSASELVRAISEYNDKKSDENPRIDIINLWNVNICSNADIVYFSPETIRGLDGVSVRIYETERKEEFGNADGITYKLVKNAEEPEFLRVFAIGSEEKEEDGEEEEKEEEHEDKQDDKEQKQDEMQFDINDDDNREDENNNAEENEQEQQPEQEQHEEQPQKKLTKKLLWNPDEKTKQLFAEMDLKAFLDKAKTDLTEAGEDPRSANIDLDALCSDDGMLRSKLALDVLLRYPLWRYILGKQNDSSVLTEEDSNKLKQLNGKVLYYTSWGNYFYAFPCLPETNEAVLVVKDNADLKYLVESKDNGLRNLADIVSHALSQGADISSIDLSSVKLTRDAKYDFKYFAGLPVSLYRGALKAISTEIAGRPGIWRLSGTDILLVRQDDDTFKIRYEPDDFCNALGCKSVFEENLKKALKDGADNLGEELIKAIESLTKDDFKYQPVIISDDGTVKSSGVCFLMKTNKVHLYDLIHGTDMGEFFREDWSKFAKELERFDKKYYKSLIVFFLCWNGNERVDFSSFSKDNFDNWQKGSNITYGRVLENLKVQETWNKCLEDVTNIPHKDELKTMFGNLKALFKSDEYMPNLDITKSERVKAFLKSIEDWGDWNNDKRLYTTDRENEDNKTACFSFDNWKNYQKWRFERFFLKGETLSASGENPIEACKQGYATWQDLYEWKLNP